MSRNFIIAGFILAVSCGQAFAQSETAAPVCHDDKISNTNGLYIRMTSGQVFQAYPGSSARLSFWAPLDKVTVCRLGGASNEITNLSKKGQVVKGLRK